MSTDGSISRRSVVLGAAGIAGASLIGTPAPATGIESQANFSRIPLWREALRRGILYGTAMSTRLFPDQEYSELVDRQAAVLFTEDDLLWYKLKPTPDSELDFTHGDQLFSHARQHRQHVMAAHLVWDEGFGPGWSDEDLWGLNEQAARRLLFDTARQLVRRYRGRTAAWIAANEVTSPEGIDGFRTNVPWYQTIGSSYVAECFHIAHDEDPAADLVLNEFGFETVNEWGDQPRDRQQATLQVLDTLLSEGVPVHALGVQAHLLADRFAERFDAQSYQRFLAQVADRGVDIHITELDVLDDGLPADPKSRDRTIGDIYRRYLDVALDEPAVKSVLSFGLSDRYTWLQEDYPREDGAPRRPLPFDEQLRVKPAYKSLSRSLRQARWRRPCWPVSQGRK